MKFNHLIVMSILLIAKPGYSEVKCNDAAFKKKEIATCKQIISSEIYGPDENRMTKAHLKISKMVSGSAVCIYGETTNARMSFEYKGVLWESGTSPWAGSQVKVFDVAKVLTVHLSGAPMLKGQRGPSDYDVLQFDERTMQLTFRINLGTAAFATLKMNCVLE
jgi:hypothetical protein